MEATCVIYLLKIKTKIAGIYIICYNTLYQTNLTIIMEITVYQSI